MPTDTSDLLGKVYDFFSGVYAAASTKQAFLAFEPLGLPMPSESFKDNATDTTLDPALAIYILSDIANAASSVNGSSLIRRNQKIDSFIRLFMDSSMPLDANSTQSLGATKLDASPAFQQTLPVPGPIPSRFYPAYASPASWYDPSVKDNWTSYSVGNQQTTQPPGTPAPPPRPIRIDPPVWRVVPPPLHAVIVSPVQLQFHPPFRPMATTVFRPNPVRTVPPAAATVPSPVLLTHPTATRYPLQVLSTQLAAIQANSQPQPVATNSISISFDYCICTITRPWFPDTLLLLRNWFVPGYSRADISNSAGAGDPGLMPLLTTGFVAIRNLKISAQWSASDLQAISGSSAFGPFSLVGRSFDTSSGMLTCSGTQIIGWFCSALPVLPPVTDPSLTATVAPPVAATGPPASTVAPAVPTSVTGTPTAATSTTAPADPASATPPPDPVSAPSTPTPAPSPVQG